jgi:hypothetical protein
MKRPAVVPLLLCLSLAGSGAYAIHRTGIVERFTGATFCVQGSHVISDPCLGTPVLYLLQASPGNELLPYECVHVDLDGPDVGIECEVVDPQTIVSTSPGCLLDTRELSVEGGSDASLTWDRTTCALSYDVIRGAIPAGPIGSTIGVVTCLDHDIPQNTNFYPEIFGPTDSENPAGGQVFFSLVRSTGAPYGGDTYGRGSDGTERVPFAGDCLF